LLITKQGDKILTFLQEKTSTAAILGKLDGATANTIRDNAINEARQFDIANYYPFSWLERTTTLTTSATGSVDLPSDFNITHRPKDIRNATDDIFGQLNKELFNTCTGNKYYIDFNTSTNKWQIHTTADSTALTIIYCCIPATLTADADPDFIPDLMAIKYLAASRYWLTERNYGNYDRFNAMGQKRLDLMVTNDKQSNPQRLTRVSAANQGWNVGW
jgi:hypothetical protein